MRLATMTAAVPVLLLVLLLVFRKRIRNLF
jgi:hypothetical protein